jgi:hypothetical protein
MGHTQHIFERNCYNGCEVPSQDRLETGEECKKPTHCAFVFSCLPPRGAALSFRDHPIQNTPKKRHGKKHPIGRVPLFFPRRDPRQEEPQITEGDTTCPSSRKHQKSLRAR